MPAPNPRQRGLARWALCLGVLMIVLDTTIANVALPSIRLQLQSGETGLAPGGANTAFMMGRALGLAVLASTAAARTESALASGAAQTAARATHRLPKPMEKTNG